VTACPRTPTACPGRASRAGSPTPRCARLARRPRPFERTGCRSAASASSATSISARRRPRATSVGGFRATSGLLIGGRSTGLGAVSTPTSGLLATDRRLFGASAAPLTYPADPSVDNTTLPYIGIGYSNLSTKSGWHFSADLGVVSQSPGNVVRFGRVFGGSQSLDDVVRDMRLAPVVQLGVSYSF
jgi:hypothetical protein